MSNVYTIMTLNPEMILAKKKISKIESSSSGNPSNHYEWEFFLDFNKGTLDEKSVLISTDLCKENAFFNQISMALENAFFTRVSKALTDAILNNASLETQSVDNNDVDIADNSLMYEVFFLDFSRMFKYKKELRNNDSENGQQNNAGWKNRVDSGISQEELQELETDGLLFFLFRNGFHVMRDGVDLRYVPFDTSASMSRKCCISFIDERLKPELDERFFLGINEDLRRAKKSSLNLKPHKYFAYRGLYLTDGTKMECNSQLVLDEDTVVVIRDYNHIAGKELKTITAQEKDGYWNIVTEDKVIKINAFDGEGIIHPDYAREINRQLFGEKNIGEENMASSFQIRMPFTKGMLHSVDFINFYKNECGIDLDKPLYVTDIYNKKRDLRKARIILTESMFKCADWIKEYTRFMADQANAEEDPMKFFFQRMRKYSHSLYIARTNLSLHNAEKKVKLNYQSLNTLSMSKEDFERKVNSYINEIRELQNDPDKQRDFALRDFKTSVSSARCAWRYALSQNITMLSEEYIKEQIGKEIDSRIKDIYRGNIRVDGENRFLSGDLLSLLVHIYKLTEGYDKTISGNLKRMCIRTEGFRAPKPLVNLESGKKYAFIRNPHLSRNEDCVLGLEAPKKIDHYFEHLSGIIMVAYGSYAPMILGGADFDGDIVKMITDQDIIDAMIKGKETCSEVVEIPSSGERLCAVPKSVSYDHIKDTFGNKIGLISNLAIRLGQDVYSQENPKKNSKKANGKQEEENSGKYIPAHCTILTGLEIDSAKNGKHPNKNIYELKAQVPERTNDYIDILNKLRALEKEKVLLGKTRKTLTDDVYTIVCSDNKKNVKIPSKMRNSNIDMLLPMYFETMYSDRTPYENELKGKLAGKISNSESIEYFTFDNQGVCAEETEEQVEVKAVFDVYKKYLWKFIVNKRNEEKNKYQNWYAKAYRVVKEQYYGRADTEEKLSLLARIYSEIEVNIVNNNSTVGLGSTVQKRCSDIIEKIKKSRWIYAKSSERFDLLKDILPSEEFVELYELKGAEEILTNFSKSGFMLLYYLVKEVGTSNYEIATNSVNVDVLKYDGKFKGSYYRMVKKANKILAASFEKAVDRKYSLMVFENMMRHAICNRLFSQEILVYAEKVYRESKLFFWKMFDGEQGMKLFKQGDFVVECLPVQEDTDDSILALVEQNVDEENPYENPDAENPDEANTGDMIEED